MKIAVTGKNGQVVQSLLALADEDHEVIALGRPDLDLAIPETIFSALAAVKPDFIISAAAYTAVDKAEDEPELAYTVNANGAGAVSAAAAKLNIPIIHLSTDYVFDGRKFGLYSETDQPNPTTIYGASKLQGEYLVQKHNSKHIILRTAWVYSPYGNNFLKTILRLGRERDEIKVVSDQHGNPTSAENIAATILKVCQSVSKGNFKDWGIYHLVDDLETTWFEWASYIIKIAKYKAIIHPINSTDYPSKAQRPQNSRLSNKKLKQAFSLDIQDWKSSTRLVIDQLKNTQN
ncbi:dTDP-4-dehydrorhamnose reductase [Pseudochrobactrum sp. XF203]|uniref:dTDP-4-dehydrorhamnose reductase n=1 Tax=Pseudochrobactrum sp. XF203 TaxID=2879116 RepID=UPI001CE34CC2|nr:dTDP-4-dehydrorhamnose reductase [Pseudochrobactrum sp. XF203]UCA47063.1 dTDP-4-dehydrorhamnose reductase [Pseudochrobactrum sp. XF203]